MAKLTKKKFASMSTDEIKKLSKPQVKDLVKQARQMYNRQAKTFERYRTTVYSHAYELMKEYYENDTRPTFSRLTRAQLQAEAIRLHEFFSSKGATVPGARKISVDVDRRIFGVNEKTGKPRFRMDINQARDFWAAYHEFEGMEKGARFETWGSFKVQQVLAEMILDRFTSAEERDDAVPFYASDFAQLKTRLNELEDYERWDLLHVNRINSILSGKRAGRKN